MDKRRKIKKDMTKVTNSFKQCKAQNGDDLKTRRSY